MTYKNYKNSKELSSTAKFVLDNKIGYRNPFIYGSGMVDALDVIKYEMEELGNLDIAYFCIDNFDISITEEEIDYVSSGKADDYEYDVFVEYFILQLEFFFYKKTRIPPENWFATWVGRVEDIIENYEGESDNIAEVSFGDKEIFILSDLAEEGVLVLSFEKPELEFGKVFIFKIN